MNEWVEEYCEISKIEELLDNGYEVEVDSPDEWVPVNFFINKGNFEEYILETKSGKIVRCNEDHLFETQNGWRYAKTLVNESNLFLTNDGWEYGIVKKTGNIIPIVDINIEHENSRYYTEGVSSHNTGVGKSLAMCSFAAGNLKEGKNVLYITMEMAEERISERIDANLMNITVDNLHGLSKDMFMNKISDLQKNTLGQLVVKEYPTSSAGAGNFRFLLNELKVKKNFVPDIIYIDYLNICASSRLKNNIANSYLYIKSIAEELRGLAVEYDLPIITATQTNRCLTLDTKVELNTGNKINISNIKIGDKIKSSSEFVTVTDVYPITKQKVYEIKLKSGKRIKCSANHIFPTPSGEKNIKSGLQTGDSLFTIK